MKSLSTTNSRRDFLRRASVAGFAAGGLSGLALGAEAESAAANTPAINVAVVTGGHSYDVVNFHKLFGSLPGVNAVIQHMDDFAASPANVRDSYDAVCFYIMLMQGPTDQGQPWYAGRPKDALEHLGSTPQGILVLHHALLAYPQWPVWSDIVGIKDRKFGYQMGQKLHINVLDAQHPITQGMSAWDMIDETYSMADAGPDSKVLLTVEHPKSMKTIGWTRQHKKARVFCYESGHDNQTWVNAGFRQVLQRGLLWCAAKI
jgi:uncharacterized protein